MLGTSHRTMAPKLFKGPTGACRAEPTAGRKLQRPGFCRSAAAALRPPRRRPLARKPTALETTRTTTTSMRSSSSI